MAGPFSWVDDLPPVRGTLRPTRPSRHRCTHPSSPLAPPTRWGGAVPMDAPRKRQRRLFRCMTCLSATLTLVCAAWSTYAFAIPPVLGPAATVGAEAWLALTGTVVGGLLTAYVRLVQNQNDDRYTVTRDSLRLLDHEQRQQQSQLNMLAQQVLRDHPGRPELERLRDEVMAKLDRLEDIVIQRRTT